MEEFVGSLWIFFVVSACSAISESGQHSAMLCRVFYRFRDLGQGVDCCQDLVPNIMSLNLIVSISFSHKPNCFKFADKLSVFILRHDPVFTTKKKCLLS